MSFPRISHIDQDASTFLEWLDNKPGVGHDSLTIRKSTNGRGLYASEYMPDGDRIIKIPFNLQLSADNLPADISKLVMEANVDEFARLALCILREKKLGQKSFWGPYVDLFPLSGEMHSTIFWRDKELDMVRPSALFKETYLLKNKIQEFFLAVTAKGPNDFTHEEFVHAYGVAMARSWKNERGSLALIPLLDILNHNEDVEAVILDNDQRQHSQIIIDREYAAGEEITISYGKFSNSVLLLLYGFALVSNKHDYALVDTNTWISSEDTLYQQKLSILSQDISSLKEDNDLYSTSWNLFKVTRVQPGCSKGTGIPVLLRAFCRVLVCDSQEELDSLRATGKTDGRVGRHCLSNKQQEKKAHKLLRKHLSELIDEQYKAINALVPKSELDEGGVIRRQLAEVYLQGVTQVLISARDWLDEYIDL